MVRLVDAPGPPYGRPTDPLGETCMAVTKSRLSLPGWGRHGPADPQSDDPAPGGPNAPDSAEQVERRTRARRRPSVKSLSFSADALDDSGARLLRILLIEDVEDVAAHLRDLLRASPTARLIGTISDGSVAVDEVRELRPDIVILDTLLRGRTKGIDLAQKFRAAGLHVGVIGMTVPDRPIADPASLGIDVVVTLPLTTFDMGRAMGGAMDGLRARDPGRSNRVVAVFGPKGGVGRTTLAFNLAASLAAQGLRTALLDGSLQYADVRRLLRIGSAAPSVCDLPTDMVRGSDLSETVIRDPSGIDVLLAPPRPEMAELVTSRDLESIVELLRRSYQAIVIDTPTSLAETTLVMLDAADIILTVVTPETGAIDAARTALDAFGAMGYTDAKVKVVINRVGTSGGLSRTQISHALGRNADAELPSDWQLVSATNAEGVPFVRERPDADVSVAVAALAASVAAVVGATPAAAPVRTRRRRG